MALPVRIEGHLPGFVRYLVAALKEDGCGKVSSQKPADCHLDRVLTCLAKLSSVNRSISSSARCPTTLAING